jgi:hypothetical protein
VTGTVLTISSQPHLDQAVQAVLEPLDESTVRRQLDLWKSGRSLVDPGVLAP